MNPRQAIAEGILEELRKQFKYTIFRIVSEKHFHFITIAHYKTSSNFYIALVPQRIHIISDRNALIFIEYADPEMVEKIINALTPILK